MNNTDQMRINYLYALWSFNLPIDRLDTILLKLDHISKIMTQTTPLKET